MRIDFIIIILLFYSPIHSFVPKNQEYLRITVFGKADETPLALPTTSTIMSRYNFLIDQFSDYKSKMIIADEITYLCNVVFDITCKSRERLRKKFNDVMADFEKKRKSYRQQVNQLKESSNFRIEDFHRQYFSVFEPVDIILRQKAEPNPPIHDKRRHLAKSLDDFLKLTADPKGHMKILTVNEVFKLKHERYLKKEKQLQIRRQKYIQEKEEAQRRDLTIEEIQDMYEEFDASEGEIDEYYPVKKTSRRRGKKKEITTKLAFKPKFELAIAASQRFGLSSEGLQEILRG